MARYLRSLYDVAADAEKKTPQMRIGEKLTFIQVANGWYLVETSAKQCGYISPAWCEEWTEAPQPAEANVEAKPAGELTRRPTDWGILKPDVDAAGAETPSPEKAKPSASTSSLKDDDEVVTSLPAKNRPEPVPRKNSKLQDTKDTVIRSRPSAHVLPPPPADEVVPPTTSSAAPAPTPNPAAAPSPAPVAARTPDVSPQKPSATALEPASNAPVPSAAAPSASQPSASSPSPQPRRPKSVANAFTSQLEAKLSGLQAGPPKPQRPKSTSVTPETVPVPRPARRAPPPPANASPASQRKLSQALQEHMAVPVPVSPAKSMEQLEEVGVESDDESVAKSEITDETAETDTNGTVSLLTSVDTTVKSEASTSSFSGYLERKPIIEAKKDSSKRRWTKFYAELKGPILLFFFNKKDFQSQKAPALQFFLDKFEVKLEEHRKYGKVISLEDENESMLLHAPTENEFVLWAEALSAGNLEEIEVRAGRATTLRLESTSTKETTPSSKDGIRYRLNRLLRARPKKSELVEKGIYQYELFGSKLSLAVEREAGKAIHEGVPIIVSKCVKRIEASILEQGIYRVSGKTAEIQTLRAQATSDIVALDLDSVSDVHAVAGLVKLYFRELEEPALTDELYPEFIAASKMSAEQQPAALKALCQRLPAVHKSTLRFFCSHMSRVTEHGDVNKMHMSNLCIVFGPTLLRKSDIDLESIIEHAPLQSSVIESIVSNQSWLE